MAMQPVANAVDVEAEIFELLKRRGPLCASQIVVRLSLPPKEIDKALKKLEADGIIERRPDRDRSIPYDESETPWGLVRPRWVHKLFTKRS
jgi:DNA-binding transcriptional ArsR family regulator